MADYEIAVIYHPDLESDLEKGSKKVEKLFSDNGGKITKTDSWGKKKMSYKIVGVDHGIYVFYTVDLPPEAVRKVEGILNITDEVIRYLITKIDHKALAKAEAIRVEKAKKAEARGENIEEDESDEEN